MSKKVGRKSETGSSGSAKTMRSQRGGRRKRCCSAGCLVGGKLQTTGGRKKRSLHRGGTPAGVFDGETLTKGRGSRKGRKSRGYKSTDIVGSIGKVKVLSTFLGGRTLKRGRRRGRSNS